MTDDIDKTRRDYKKKNKYHQLLRDSGDYKGAFSMKVIDGRKSPYRRERIRVTDIEQEED